MTYYLYHKVSNDNKYSNIQCVISTNYNDISEFDETLKNMAAIFTCPWLLQKYFWRMIGDSTFANNQLRDLIENKVTTVIWNNTKLNN